MIIFTIIGICVVIWIIFNLITKPSQKSYDPGETVQKIKVDSAPHIHTSPKVSDSHGRLFKQLVFTASNMVKNLNPVEKEKSQVELLLICISYTSIFCSSYFSSKSDKIDTELLEELKTYLKNSKFARDIISEFGYSNIVDGIDSFIRTRVRAAANEFKFIQILGNDDKWNMDFEEHYSHSDSPINLFNAVMTNPLKNFKETEATYQGSLNTPVFEFETKLCTLFCAMIKYLQDNIPQLYSTPDFPKFDTNSFRFAHESMFYEFYYPLYNNFCVMCSSFYPSDKMHSEIVSEEFSSFNARVCNYCSPPSKLKPIDQLRDL